MARKNEGEETPASQTFHDTANQVSQSIRDASSQVRDAAAEKIGQIRDNANEYYEQGKQRRPGMGARLGRLHPRKAPPIAPDRSGRWDVAGRFVEAELGRVRESSQEPRARSQ